MGFGRAIYCQLFDFRTGRSMILCPTPCILPQRRKFLLFQHEDTCMISNFEGFLLKLPESRKSASFIKKAYCDGIENPQPPQRMERLTCCVLEHSIPHSLIPYGLPDEPSSSADGWVSLLPWVQWSIKGRCANVTVFLVVLCLLPSPTSIFYACFRVTLIDVTVAKFGHPSREAWICSYFSIQ